MLRSSFVSLDLSQIDIRLRPQKLSEFVGQKSLCERLAVVTAAAKGRSEPLNHLLFYGPPGLGKTTLAHILAEEMGGRLVVTSGAVLEKAGDLAGLLTSLEEGDFLFIDEIHRLPRQLEEYLYPAIEDFRLDLVVDTGVNARSIPMHLHRFTLIGATTQVGKVTAPLRSRFAHTFRMDYYPEDELAHIALRSSKLLGVEADLEALLEIAKRSRGTPRILNNLLRWTRDVASTRNLLKIDSSLARESLDMLSIDGRGLDLMDKRILEVLMQHGGGPLGLSTIAAMVGEEAQTIAEVYEPYLLMQGFLRIMPRGRQVTEEARRHLGYGVSQ